jgi:hypothetical protein
MQTNSYESWMRRPLSSAVCPTPDIWPDDVVPTLTRHAGSPSRRHAERSDKPAPCANAHPRPHARSGYGRITQVESARRSRPTDTIDMETMMNEEKSRILKMLEEKKITAEQAMKLLDALDRTESRPTDRELKKKWLHIRVEKDGRQTVNLKLPLSLLKFGFKFAPQRHARRQERIRATHERTMARAERARARAEETRAKIEKKLRDKFGAEVEINLNGVLDEAFADMEIPPVPTVPPIHGSPLNDILDGDFDLDLEKILEMAQDPDFDGKVLDVYDDDDDEHVRITLE